MNFELKQNSQCNYFYPLIYKLVSSRIILSLTGQMGNVNNSKETDLLLPKVYLYAKSLHI